jgi:DNA-binding GntR family transcriptional regulator
MPARRRWERRGSGSRRASSRGRGILSERGPLYIAERHWPLLECLRAGDVRAAEDAMEEHLRRIGDEVLARFDDGSHEP